MDVVEPIERVIAGHPELEVVLLFGSMASGQGRPDSDVDLAVQAAHPLDAASKLALIAELGDATGRPVDLIDLRVVGEPLLGEILTHGKRLRGSHGACAELLRRHLFDAADFLPYVERLLAERRRAWIG
ncbi:MAG: nucleotidyltransferase domain-containing protein [Burkholderiales bacterium]|nr:nucleotidyltransferase domain-containing protein [Burkholderiales bacterium]